MQDIGPRLKSLRKGLRLSQRQLATAAGVSNATISLIEAGRSDPSMGLLKRVLDAMGVSLAQFFADDRPEQERYFYRREELSRISRGRIDYLQVGGDLSDSRLQILYERYEPGADTGQSLLRHDSEEGGIVIQGLLEVTVGEQVQLLSAGDAYRFNSRLPHRFRNPGAEPCVVVSACTPPSF